MKYRELREENKNKAKNTFICGELGEPSRRTAKKIDRN